MDYSDNGQDGSQKETYALQEESSDSTHSSNYTIEKVRDRERWSSKFDFILACVGFAVGLGNIWRFPYLCYKNGGGAFLVPYFILLITCGVPVFLLELSLGQYMSLGSIGAWGRIVPGFQGIAVASFVITFLMNIYYIIILAWGVYYLYMSFTTTLPWASCNNEWNTDRCFDGNSVRSASDGNVSVLINSTTADTKTVDAVVEFWERKVLHISGGIDEPGTIVWELALSLLFVWILVYFCVWKGIRWSGKIVYFTALFPYLILTILLLRGITLDGAADGITFYLKPDFSRLADTQVWIDGGTQIFFSYAVAIGAMITLGSYNKFNNNVYRHCLIISGINSMTSLYGGIAVFSVLGFMAKEQNVTVAEVADSGPGLVFIAYPKAVTQMPASPVWATLFFFMLLLVGLDSQFVSVEGFLTPIFDMFPEKLHGSKSRMCVAGVYCFVSYLLGLSMITEGGMYVFQLFDYYSASGLVLLWVCLFEAVVVAWVFGAERFADAIELMSGQRVPVWFVLCWKYLLPAISLGMILFMLIDFSPLTYNKTYVYPDLAQWLGICMALVSILCVPTVLCYKLARATGSLKQKWAQITTPMLSAHQIPDKWKTTTTPMMSVYRRESRKTTSPA